MNRYSPEVTAEGGGGFADFLAGAAKGANTATDFSRAKKKKPVTKVTDKMMTSQRTPAVAQAQPSFTDYLPSMRPTRY